MLHLHHLIFFITDKKFLYCHSRMNFYFNTKIMHIILNNTSVPTAYKATNHPFNVLCDSFLYCSSNRLNKSILRLSGINHVRAYRKRNGNANKTKEVFVSLLSMKDDIGTAIEQAMNA